MAISYASMLFAHSHEIRVFIILHFINRLINKLAPGTIPRIDAREDGVTKCTNMVKFLRASIDYGVAQIDLFPRDAFLSPTAENMMTVAATISAISQVPESPPQSRFNSKSPYSNATYKMMGTMSSPSLVQTASTPLPKRFSPPQGSMASSPPNASLNRMSPTPQGRNRTPEPSPMIPSPPPRSPLRLPSGSARASMASVGTESTHAYSSMFDNKSTRYGTIRTVNTEATSFIPSGVSSFTRSEANSILSSLQKGEAGAGPSIDPITPPTRRRSNDFRNSPDRISPMPIHPSLASAVEHDNNNINPTRTRRDRKSSEVAIDLGRVLETDETDRGMDRTVSAERRRAVQRLEARANGGGHSRMISPEKARPQYVLGKGRQVEDFEHVFNQPLLLDDDESLTKKQCPSPISVPRSRIDGVVATNGAEELRPLHPLPGRPTRRPSNRLRQRSTDILPPKDGLLNSDDAPSNRDSSTPSPPTSALARRRSSMTRPIPAQRGNSFVRNSTEERRPASPRQAATPSPSNVPFPGSTTNLHESAITMASSSTTIGKKPAVESRLDQSLTSNETLTPRSAIDLSSSPTRPAFPRMRRQSDFESGRNGGIDRQRPGSTDDPVGVHTRQINRRLRHESMVNLGGQESGHPDLKRLSSGSGLSSSAVRETLTMKEEGKPPVNYVRIIFYVHFDAYY